MDLSPHPLDQFLADGQSQPEAFGVAPPVEALEEVGNVLLAYAGTLIFHGDAGPFGTQPDAPTFLRVLESVAHEHEQRLLEPLLVCHGVSPSTLDRELEQRLREALHPLRLGTDVRHEALSHPRIVVLFRK